jgi:tubulin delta
LDLALLLFPEDDPESVFFREKDSDGGDVMIPRSVLVDMEAKVVEGILSSLWSTSSRGHSSLAPSVGASSMHSTRVKFDKKRSFVRQSGCANNWGFGFTRQGPKHAESILDLIRKEVESCDVLGGLLTLQSVAGGTGSGVGAYIAQELRDAYPSAFLMNQIVWPYTHGEVIVQNYNTALSMSHLMEVRIHPHSPSFTLIHTHRHTIDVVASPHILVVGTQHSDACWVFHNDDAELICKSCLQLKSPSFVDLNTVIALNMSSILLPSYPCEIEEVHTRTKSQSALSSSSGRGVQSPSAVDHELRTTSSTLWAPLGDTIQSLCTHPGYRIITSKMIPVTAPEHLQFSTYTWGGMTKHLHMMARSNARSENHIRWYSSREAEALGPSFISNAVFFRGPNFQEAGQEASRFFDPSSYVSWTRSSLNDTTSPLCPVKLNGSLRSCGLLDKCASVISNGSGVEDVLEDLLRKLALKFQARAYLHHYSRFDVSNEDMQLAFLEIDQVRRNYRAIRSFK